MSRRRITTVFALIALLLTLAAAPAAPAQDNSPFSPLPPATPEQTVTTTQAASTSQDDSGIKTWQAVLIVIGGVILLAGIGIGIARDARRRAPVIDTAHSTEGRDADSHRRARQTKQRQRQRAKAARAARRKNR